MGSFLCFCFSSTLLKYASACPDGKPSSLLENTLLFVCFLSSFSFYSFLILPYYWTMVVPRNSFAFSATSLDDLVTKKTLYMKK